MPQSKGVYLRDAFSSIALELSFLIAFDMLVAIAYVYWGWTWLAVPHIPLSIFGGAIGVIVGFRNNTSYQRWWEARTIWGSIVNYSRTLGRQALTLIRADAAEQDSAWQTQRNIVSHQIAYVHALRCQLRGQDPLQEIAGLLPAEEIDSLKSARNVALEIQDRMGRLLRKCFDRRWIDSIRWSALEQTLTALANAQGGAERIKNTPMPRQYDYLPKIFVSVYCILLPLGMVDNLKLFTPIGSTLVGVIFLALDKIGRQLETPFENTIHDVPLTAITQTIETNLRQQLHETELLDLAQPVEKIFS